MGAIGGGAMSRVSSGWEAARFAWEVGFVFFCIYFCIVTLLWPLQKKSVRYTVLSGATFAMSLLIFISSFILPAYFLIPIWSVLGACFTVFWVGITIFQCCRVSKYFARQWRNNGHKAIEKSFKADIFNLDIFNKHLSLDPPDILSAENENNKNFIVSYAVKASVILLILIGFNLRNIFPIFSVFAYAIPMCLISTWMFQMLVIAYHYFQIFIDLEKQRGQAIVAVGSV